MSESQNWYIKWLEEQYAALTALRADLDRVTRERDALKDAIRDVIDDRHITSAEEYVVLSLTVEEYRNFDALAAVKPETCVWTHLFTGIDYTSYKTTCGRTIHHNNAHKIDDICDCGRTVVERNDVCVWRRKYGDCGDWQTSCNHEYGGMPSDGICLCGRPIEQKEV